MGNGSSTKANSEKLSSLAKSTLFTQKELSAWQKSWSSEFAHCNGLLTPTAFLDIWKAFYPFGDPIAYSALMFPLFDSNKDGLISFPEFARALSLSSKGTLQDKLTWIFKLYDQDGDEMITRAVFKFILMNII
jgi:Ca2+-binding EF-hand superfamily protein